MFRGIQRLFVAAGLAFAFMHGAQAASAVALAIEPNGDVPYGWEDHAKTLDDAKRSAIQSCRNGAEKRGLSPDGCHVVLSKTTTGYWSIFNRTDRGGIGVGYSPKSQQEATDDAYRYCTQDGAQCDETASHYWFDDGKGADSRQGGRYHISCRNSSCVRNYDSGRVVRFRACVNPSTGFAFDNLDGSCQGLDMSNHMLNN